MLKEALDIGQYTWSIYAGPPLLVGAGIALLGFLVLLRERISKTTLSFFGMTMSGAVWLIGYGVSYLAQTESAASFWIKLSHVGIVFIPSTVYLFAASVVNRLRAFAPYLIVSFFFSALFCGLCLFTDFFIRGLYNYFWGHYAHYGILSIPFLIFFFSRMVLSLRLLSIEYCQSRAGARKDRLKVFRLALAIAYLGSFDFLAAFGIPLYPFGYLPVLVFLVMSAQAIWLYRLFDITPAIAAGEIIDTMGEAMFVVDPEGMIRIANRAAGELFRAHPDTLIGRPVAQVVGGELFTAKRSTLIELGRIRNYQMERLLGKEKKQVLNLSVSVMRDEGGAPVAMICVAQDITERQAMERLIQEGKEYAESIVETVREPLLVLDGELRVKTANQAYYQTFRTAPSRTENRLFAELAQRQWDIPALLQLLRETISMDLSFENFEVEREFLIIGRRALMLNGRRLCRPGPAPLVLLAIEDITERKIAEEGLKKAYVRLQETQRELIQTEKLAAIGKFSSGLAHEVKNPLGIILGGTEFLERKLANAEPETREALGKIKESILRADHLVKGLLQFGRPSQFKMELFHPEECIIETLGLLQYRASLENIRIESEFAAGDVWIEADKNQIQQVLFNLLLNAVEAMPRGGLLAAKTKVGESSNGDPRPPCVAIEISDTGEGISEENFNRVFEPFFTTKGGKGTGLGLSIAKIIAERHGGTLSLRSRFGEGTTAALALPVARREVAVTDEKRFGKNPSH